MFTFLAKYILEFFIVPLLTYYRYLSSFSNGLNFQHKVYIFIIWNPSQPLYHRYIGSIHITAFSDYSLMHFSQFTSSRFDCWTDHLTGTTKQASIYQWFNSLQKSAKDECHLWPIFEASYKWGWVRTIEAYEQNECGFDYSGFAWILLFF